MIDPTPAEQNRELRRTLRDLVALSVMPSAWIGRDPLHIVQGLLDVLVSTLRLDVAYVRLKYSEEENSACLWRAERWPELPSWISATEAEQGAFQRPCRFAVTTPVSDHGPQELYVFVTPVGFHAINGIVAAGCTRSDFPTEIENLLLAVAANQAATAFQSAQLLANRKQAEEGAGQLAAIVESSNDAIIGKDLEGTITSWNRGAERLYGYLAAEVVGRPISVLAPPEHVNEIPEIMERLKQGERIEQYETHRIAKDGRRLTVALNISPIRNKQGRIIGASTVAHDISERKQSEQRIAAQHAITRILAEAATLAQAAPKIVKTICQLLNWEFGALWQVDQETHVLTCLDTWRMPGVSVPEFESTSRQCTFPAGVGLPGRVWSSGAPAWIADVTRDDNFPRAPVAAEEGLHGAFGFPIVMGNEVLGVMEFFSREIREPDPDLLEMMATVGSQIGQFIERRRAELALQDLEDRFRRAQVAASLGAYDWNLHTGEIKWSAEIPALREVAPGGKFETWMEHVHPDDRERLQQRIARLLGEGGEMQAEVRVVRPDGGPVWVLTKAQLLRDRQGQPAHVIGVAIDITDRKRTEDALRHAEKLAATGQLAATIAHEINNPMQALTNIVALISDKRIAEEDVRELAAVAGKELKRMAHITRQMLSFYREPTAPAPVHLSEVLDDVLALWAAKLRAKRIRLVRRYEFQGRLEVFPGEVRQMFANLIGNAVEAVPSGGTIHLHVFASRHGKDSAQRGVRIVVADDGPGIEPQYRHKVFEPFFTTKGEKGTGLGLWVVNGIVQKHSGSVRLRSSTRPGRSFTCISIFLPDRSGHYRIAPALGSGLAVA